jgi:MFS family permease
MFAGFSTIWQSKPLRVLTTLLTAQTLILGTLEVYIVVIAFELVHKDAAGVGLINSAMGVGAILGGIVMLSMTGAKRFSAPFAIGVALLGAPLVLVGAIPNFALALVLLGVVGFGSSVLDVAGITLVQRVVPDEVLARVFGVIQMLWYLSLSLGALTAPGLIGLIGTKASIIVTGASLVVLVAALWAPLSKIDATTVAPDAEGLALLSSVPIFAPLSGVALEHVASRLLPLQLDAGTVVIREGDSGDRFYIVADGILDVSTDGARVAEITRGDHFGEIALLRDVPRTATVTAKNDVRLYALDREDFLAAVTGSPPSAQAAETIVTTRLGRSVTGDTAPAPAS